MKRLLAVLSAALLMSVFTLAQRDQSTSSSSQSLTTSAAQSANQNSASATQEQSNPAGGSPNSAVPGRVTGEEPTRVQEALN
ncbi:MAG: hypothetical protein JOZ10_04915, partial [Acidobacteria bacterium]|nr:hypothetical protein [Acidobacteriota bacterium]